MIVTFSGDHITTLPRLKSTLLAGREFARKMLEEFLVALKRNAEYAHDI